MAGGIREKIEEQMDHVFDEYLRDTWFGQRVMGVTCYTVQRSQRWTGWLWRGYLWIGC